MCGNEVDKCWQYLLICQKIAIYFQLRSDFCWDILIIIHEVLALVNLKLCNRQLSVANWG